MATEETEILERVEQIGLAIDNLPRCKCVREDNENEVHIRVILDVKVTSSRERMRFAAPNSDLGLVDDITDAVSVYLQNRNSARGGWVDDSKIPAIVTWHDYSVSIGHEHGCYPTEPLRREK